MLRGVIICPDKDLKDRLEIFSIRSVLPRLPKRWTDIRPNSNLCAWFAPLRLT